MTRIVARQTIIIACVLAALIALGAPVGWMLAEYWSLRYRDCSNVYEPIRLSEHKAVVVDNDFIQVERYWHSGDDRQITVTRALMCDGADGKPIHVPLPTSSGSHPAGPGMQIIRVDLPNGLMAGSCLYLSRVAWQCSALKQQFVDLPPLTVTLTATSK